MKKFAGTKRLTDIMAQCKAAGVAVDDYGFRTEGRDYIAIGIADLILTRPDGSPFVHVVDSPTGGWVMFNTFNGTFYGETPTMSAWLATKQDAPVGRHLPPISTHFDSNKAEHEREPWFQALLSFFYVEKDQPGAEKPKTTTLGYMLAA